jgi:hypothetical protein
MTMKLEQKHIYKGKRSFELVDDAVNVHIDMPFLNKEFTVVLSILVPEPVVKGSTLAFVSAVNREPLIEMFVDSPNAEEFNAFVQKVKEKVIEEDYGKPKSTSPAKVVKPELVQETIDMLCTYLNADDIRPLLTTLEALKEKPEGKEEFDAMVQAFEELGPMQGAVLSYAPYINSLLLDGGL